jgi:hypothetical protein
MTRPMSRCSELVIVHPQLGHPRSSAKTGAAPARSGRNPTGWQPMWSMPSAIANGLIVWCA